MLNTLPQVELLSDASVEKTAKTWKHWPLFPGEPPNVYCYSARVLSKPIGWQVTMISIMLLHYLYFRAKIGKFEKNDVVSIPKKFVQLNIPKNTIQVAISF